jgi:hypothetical protein
MNWFYSQDGQQRGPVNDAQLDELVASGVVRPETLVWCEGMSAWAAYSQARPNPQAAAASPTSAGVLCAVCGRAFRPDEVVRLENRFVCAACKPVFLQQLQEGVALPYGGSTQGSLGEAELLARDYAVDVGGCLSRSWEMFKADAGLIIGASVLAYLILMACAFIPILGGIAQLIIQGAVLGGIWLFYVRKARGEAVVLGDAFSGFGPKFWTLFLTQLIPGLIVVAILIVPAIAVGVGIVAVGQGGGRPALSGGLLALIIFGGLVMFCLMTYLNLSWLFALPLVADKGLGPWQALELSRKMVAKHFWRTLLMAIVACLLALVGGLLCLVGMLVTGPVAFGMFAHHYQRVFGDLRKLG